MMGHQDRSFVPLPPVSLDTLVPPNHFSRHLERLLSWRGWGRRPFPSGAAGVALQAVPPLPAPTP